MGHNLSPHYVTSSYDAHAELKDNTSDVAAQPHFVRAIDGDFCEIFGLCSYTHNHELVTVCPHCPHPVVFHGGAGAADLTVAPLTM